MTLKQFFEFSDMLSKSVGIAAGVFATAGLCFRCIPQLWRSFLLTKDTLYRNNSDAFWVDDSPTPKDKKSRYDGHWLIRNVKSAWFCLASMIQSFPWVKSRSPFHFTRLRLERWIFTRGEKAKISRSSAETTQGERADCGPCQIAIFENISDLLNEEKCSRYIASYFRALQKHGKWHDQQKPLESLSLIQVNKGFVAPMFLLSGLLPRLEQDWRVVGESYETWRILALHHFPHLTPLVSLQSFLFDCWLLWGPSISLPNIGKSCNNWKADYVAAQFGFGDENNSICLISDHPGTGPGFLQDWVESARTVEGQKSSLQYPFALPARLTNGKLWFVDDRFNQLSSGEIQRRVGNHPKFGLATAAAGHPGWDRSFSLKGRVGIDSTRSGHYYSAYLWALFVTLNADSGALLIDLEGMSPATFHKLDPGEKQSIGRWRNLLTFFEHGNIADADAYTFLEKHLAVKTAQSLWTLASNTKIKPSPVFVYGGALDDLNCRCCESIESETQQLWKKINRELIRIASNEENQKMAQETRSKIIMPDNPLHPRNYWNKNSEDEMQAATDWTKAAKTELEHFCGCHLFEVIAGYYGWLDSERKRKEN